MDETRTPFFQPKVEELIATYLDSVQQGQRPDRTLLLQEHAQFAPELQTFFADQDRLEETAPRSSASGTDPSQTALNVAGPAGTGSIITDATLIGVVGESSPRPVIGPGTLVGGRYLLIETISEGGMGVVWLAEQQKPVTRKVALKLVKAGMDSREVLVRFEAERQALALMDHPHIARIFDGGMTDQGRPYFVMEFVKGMTFIEYCDWARLPLRDRLQLFILVCHAVQHAHHKGIIHRDLKPSNILVNLSDGKPVPKVIDFGLAKALHQPLTDSSIDTNGGNMVGTPLYMSPEQAEYNNLDVDTRTDIYSLGVVLYELLTGTTPIERQKLQKAKFDEMLRLIQEVEPPRPSLRISGDDTLPAIAALRCIDPNQLRRSLSGDLDWIVMKALEKDRNRRYETTNSLARDIERFLNDEAVEACPPSTTYRMRKFVRKNRGKVTAGTVLLLTLVFGIMGTTWGFVRAKAAERAANASEQLTKIALVQVQQERDAKEEQRRIAQQAEEQILASYLESTDDVITNLIGSKDDLGPQERAYLDKTLQRWQKFAELQGSDERTRKFRAEGLFQVGVLWRKLGRYPDARTKLEQALEIQNQLVQQSPDESEYRHELARIHIGHGVLVHEIGEKDTARREYETAKGILQQLVQQSPGVPEYRLDLARSGGNLGFLFDDLGEWDRSRAEYVAARDVLRQLVQQFPDVPEYQGKLVKLHHGLGDILIQMGDPAAARQEFESARDIDQKLVETHPDLPEHQFDLSVSHYSLGDILVQLGQRDSARLEFEAARNLQLRLMEQFPAVPHYQRGYARSRFALGNLIRDFGQQPAARSEYEAARKIQSQLARRFPTVPVYQDQLADSHFALGETLQHLGDRASALTDFEAAQEIFQRLVLWHPTEREYQVKLAGSLICVGGLLNQNGDCEAAQAKLIEARNLYQKLVDQFPSIPHYQRCLARSHDSLAGVLRNLGQLPEARTEFETARHLQQQLVEKFPKVAVYQANLADSHFGLGDIALLQNDPDLARAEYRTAQEIIRGLVEQFPNIPEYRATFGGSKCSQGQMILKAGHAAESLVWFIQAIDILKQVLELDPSDARAQLSLRNSYWGRAAAYSANLQYDESLLDWDQAIALSPETERAGLRIARAISRLRLGQIAAAVEEAHDVLRLAEPMKTSRIKFTDHQLYDLARIYSVASEEATDQRAEYSDLAMQLLKQSVQMGLNSVDFSDRLAGDFDFDPLREREDFTQFVESLSKPPESPPASPPPPPVAVPVE